jgi:hypothetical protein
LDERVHKYIKKIVVTDEECKHNDYYTKIFGRPVKAVATAGNGIITIYPQKNFLITGTLYHEIGHLIDQQYRNGTMRASEAKIYQYIYKYKTKLSNHSIREDFAEAVKYYFMGYEMDYLRTMYIERVINYVR